MLFEVYNRKWAAGLFVALFLYSCNPEATNSPVFKKIKIDESERVFHYAPPILTVMDDSIIGVNNSRLHYTLYNYRTGALKKELSFILPPAVLINFAEKIDGKQYGYVSPEDLEGSGFPTYELANVALDSDTAYFNFMIVADIKNSPDTAWYHRLQFILKSNHYQDKIYSIKYFKAVDISANSYIGFEFFHGNLFFSNGISPNNLNEGKLVVAKETKQAYLPTKTILPLTLEEKSNVAKKNPAFLISFFKTDSTMYLSDQTQLYTLNSDKIKSLDIPTIEGIAAIGKSRENQTLFLYTFQKEGNVLYSYNLKSKKLTEKAKFEDNGPGAFYNNTLIRMVNDKDGYWFYVYDL